MHLLAIVASLSLALAAESVVTPLFGDDDQDAQVEVDALAPNGSTTLQLVAGCSGALAVP